jgi:hypothetical protein
MCAVAEHDWERNAIKTASYRSQIGHGVLLGRSRGEWKIAGDSGGAQAEPLFDASAEPSTPGSRASTIVPAPSGKV